jgi:hypothetical protein
MVVAWNGPNSHLPFVSFHDCPRSLIHVGVAATDSFLIALNKNRVDRRSEPAASNPENAAHGSCPHSLPPEDEAGLHRASECGS